MKEKLLASLEKKTLRQAVKTLTGKDCDKTNREELVKLLREYSYMQIVRAIQ